MVENETYLSFMTGLLHHQSNIFIRTSIVLSKQTKHVCINIVCGIVSFDSFILNVLVNVTLKYFIKTQKNSCGLFVLLSHPSVIHCR